MDAGVPHRDPVRRRGLIEVRWRQFRNAPRPVVRAVAVSVVAAVGLGSLFLAYDLAVAAGQIDGGADRRPELLVVYVVAVLAIGAIGTYLVVPQPTGAGGRPRRSAWSAALGLFAAIPIAYLVLVLLFQVIRPALAG